MEPIDTTDEQTNEPISKTQEKVPQSNVKKARSEGNRVAMAIKGTKAEFYVADVDLDDQEGDVSVSAEAVRKTLGKVSAGFMLISAGVSHLIVVVDIPNDKTSKLSAKAWLSESLKGISDVSEGTDNLAKAVIQIDMPFKLKDIVRSTAFAYLRKCGLLEEEESEEEMYEF